MTTAMHTSEMITHLLFINMINCHTLLFEYILLQCSVNLFIFSLTLCYMRELK